MLSKKLKKWKAEWIKCLENKPIFMRDENIEKEIEEAGVKKYQYESFIFKFLNKYFPWILDLGFSIFAKFHLHEVSALHKELNKSKSIDIFPTSRNRGFILVIDRKKALYFYQDGDHFSYDGCEVGEYEKGNVTIFDNIKNPD